MQKVAISKVHIFFSSAKVAPPMDIGYALKSMKKVPVKVGSIYFSISLQKRM